MAKVSMAISAMLGISQFHTIAAQSNTPNYAKGGWTHRESNGVIRSESGEYIFSKNKTESPTNKVIESIGETSRAAQQAYKAYDIMSTVLNTANAIAIHSKRLKTPKRYR